jgi:hypothetical protein
MLEYPEPGAVLPSRDVKTATAAGSGVRSGQDGQREKQLHAAVQIQIVIVFMRGFSLIFEL